MRALVVMILTRAGVTFSVGWCSRGGLTGEEGQARRKRKKKKDEQGCDRESCERGRMAHSRRDRFLFR